MNIPAYYEFCNRVKTFSGHKALDQLPQILQNLKAKKPLIITDKGVSAAGLITIVNKALGTKVKAGAIYDDVPPDSDLKVVNKVAEVYKNKGCDAIVAVGGGSVLDTAKGVNILVSENADDLMRFTGAGAVKRKLKPLIAIPTTSGTGSEVTLVAVIADHENSLKMVFTSIFLLPDAAILDSRMTKTLPPFLTALTAMDAMSHAVESYICIGKNPLSDAHALSAIELISQNLLNVVKKPKDLEGRLALANASILAGAAFSNSMVGMVHNLGHATGAICHVPHGSCMSIFLPYGLEYNLHKSEKAIGELYFALAGAEAYNDTPVKERPFKTIEFLRNLNEELHTATDGRHSRFLGEIFDRDNNPMVPQSKLKDIAVNAMGDGAKIYNPEELSLEDNLMVLQHAFDGTPLNLKKIKKG